MPRFGTHASVAGGPERAVARAVALGCDAMQIFTRNPNQWRASPLDRLAVRDFRQAVDASGITPVVSHASYLINLATASEPLRTRSLEALGDEMDRAEQLGLHGVVLHPGTCAAGQPDDEGLDHIAAAARTVLVARRRGGARLLFEHTAGQGSCVGWRFEHLAGLIERLDGSPRVGVCLDTCHLLAAGYDISSPDGYRLTFAGFHRLVGIDRLAVFHVNDSKRPCGSRVDRHAHIGDGFVGLDAFRRLVNDRRFRTLPMLLETEKLPVRRTASTTPDPLDEMNLGRLRGLVR